MAAQLAISAHILSVVIWVGGMFFAYMAMRPAAASVLEPPKRLPLWLATFKRFFPWVWLAIITILASGYFIIFGVYQGFANTPIFAHVMNGLGTIMMLIFFHVFFAPYRRLTQAVNDQDWPAGGKALNQIRFLIGLNLLIGLITIVVATLGKVLF